jgi:hypothetical protein
MPRNDPTDTGGLFIGRRPGTGPLRYRGDPKRAGEKRRRADAVLATVVLVLETLVCLTLWGPQPVAWLWVGSQVDYHAGSITLALAVTFAGMMATLMFTLGPRHPHGPHLADSQARRGSRAAGGHPEPDLRGHGDRRPDRLQLLVRDPRGSVALARSALMKRFFDYTASSRSWRPPRSRVSCASAATRRRPAR